MLECIKTTYRLIGMMKGKLSDETLRIAVENTPISTEELLGEIQSDRNIHMTVLPSHPMAGRQWMCELTSSLN